MGIVELQCGINFHFSLFYLAVYTSTTKPMPPESLKPVWPSEDFARHCGNVGERASQPQAKGIQSCCPLYPSLCMRDLDCLPTTCRETQSFPPLLSPQWQDIRFLDTEILEQTSVHTMLRASQLRWTGHITGMSDERLPAKRVLYGELQTVSTLPWRSKNPLQGHPESLHERL